MFVVVIACYSLPTFYGIINSYLCNVDSSIILHVILQMSYIYKHCMFSSFAYAYVFIMLLYDSDDLFV